MPSPLPNEIALFPLNTVLFPQGRTALEVFEARYMDLVRTSLKADEGFGIVLIREGSEVYQPGSWRPPELEEIGCYGRIVDWDAMPGNRLGLVLEGYHKFRILEASEDSAHLVRGRVEWLAEEADTGLPPTFELLPPLLERLAEHASIRKLGLQTEPRSALCVANQLAQLLPIANAEKQALLELDNPIERLQALEQLLAKLEA